MENLIGKSQNWTREKYKELLKIIGEGNAKKLLSGELSIEFKEIIRKLSGSDFKLTQPNMNTIEDYARILNILANALNINVLDIGITAEEFKSKTEEILDMIPNDTASIKDRTWFSLVLPKFEGDDIGAFLEKLLDGVNNSCKMIFGDKYNFFNYQKGNLINQVKSVCKTQDELIEKMKEGPVVVVFFPNTLQGFSIMAARGQISFLSKGFVQSGIETIVAMIEYVDILAKNYETPGLFLSAFSWKSEKYSLSFKAFSNELYFVSTEALFEENDCFSPGLSFFI